MEKHTMSASVTSGGSAPSYDVPQERIVSIEHPCIVQNFSNAFKSLGGEHQLKHVLEHEIQTGKAAKSNHVDPVAGLSLRPNDPFAKKLSSTASPNQNVLIKVTAPKRTGRKRKRGSDVPFTESTDTSTHGASVTAPELLQRLRDNADTYSLQAVGIIQDTHRFSDLPDFQIRGDDVPILREFRDHAMEPNYDKLKSFNINFNSEINPSSLFSAPPSFVKSAKSGDLNELGVASLTQLMSKQSKAQPTAIRQSSASIGKTFTELSISLETEDVPEKAPEDLPKQLGGAVKLAVEALEKLFKERPIVSTRMFNSTQPGHTATSLRAAIPHLGYYLNSGPWGRTIVKYGVDPRKDPSMREYQTILISFKGVANVTIPGDRRCEESKGHIFDGTRASTSSNIWQLCDLTDPTLQHIIQIADVRNECEVEQWGWYHNGTMAKIRVILRDKMIRLVNAEDTLPEEDYMALAALPDNVKEVSDCDASLLGDKVHLRTMCHAIARDAVYRSREASAADMVSNVDGAADRESVDVDEGAVDGGLSDDDYFEE